MQLLSRASHIGIQRSCNIAAVLYRIQAATGVRFAFRAEPIRNYSLLGVVADRRPVFLRAQAEANRKVPRRDGQKHYEIAFGVARGNC